MATASALATGSFTLTDPAGVLPSSRATGSVVLNDPTGPLQSSRAEGSFTLAAVEPTSGPRVWIPAVRRWIPARVRHHSPGTPWQ